MAARKKLKEEEPIENADIEQAKFDEPEFNAEDVAVAKVALDKSNRSLVDDMFRRYNGSNKTVSDLAAEEIYAAFSDYVYRIADNKFGSFLQRFKSCVEDILQSGWIAFFAAAKSYVPELSSPSTYFYYPTMHGMYQYINGHLLEYPSERAKGNMQRCQKAIQKLNESGIDKPTICDIAIESGLTVAVVRKTLSSRELVASKVSLQDENVSECPDPYGVTPEKIARDAEQQEVIRAAFDRMLPSALHRKILCYKFGVLGSPELSDAEIAKRCRITIKDVSRVEADAMNALRNSVLLAEYWRSGVQGKSLRTALHSQFVSDTHESAGLAMLGMINEGLGYDGLEVIAV